MVRIALAVLMLTVLVARPLPAEEHAHTIVMPETLQWVEPAPLPGALLAVVQGDPHLHKASENVTVLSGLFFIGSGEKLDQAKGQELPVGAFLSVPPNHPHYAWVGGAETVVQVHGVGPTDLRFVNPGDDPRRKK